MQKVQYLVAALHDAHERGDGPPAVPVEQVLAHSRLAALFRGDLDHLVPPAGEEVIQVLGRAMELLRADNEVHVRQAVNQLVSPALGDAAQEAEHDVRPAAAGLSDEIFHLAQRLLLGQVPHGAGVEQDDVGGGLRRREGITLGDELGGDSFTVALVHLAPVSFDIDTRHWG